MADTNDPEEAGTEAPATTDWLRRGRDPPPRSREFTLGKEIQAHLSRERAGMRGSDTAKTLLTRSKFAAGGGQGGSAFDARHGRGKGPPRDSPPGAPAERPTWPPGRSTEGQQARERADRSTTPDPPPDARSVPRPPPAASSARPPGEERDR